VDPVVILSPHLDDAVLSCGRLMAGRPDTVVATLMAGVPVDRSLRPFDKLCGFIDAEQAVRGRSVEDAGAVSLLRGQTVHFQFIDSQYGEPNDFVAMKRAVRVLVDELDPEYVLAPLGIGHPDHATTSQAALETVPWERLVFYEELPARVLWPELVQPALDAIRDELESAVPRGALERTFLGTGDLAMKQMAVKRYVSQRGTLAQLEDGAGWYAICCPERYWKVTL